ncbi:MAG TPA: SDR family NAD(P)-dependent oxidoreductase, partial [Ignavibacteriaceae bacterium]|nr:SDR family NAD(P)-dependent oxidoreductase [Ignavibacteriaceae bacterium]
TQLSDIPPKNKWREIIRENHIDNALNQKLRKLIELEESGGTVTVYTAPVSDKKKMKEVIELVKNRYGEINGIIHCAGIVKPGIISAKEKGTIENVFLSKVEGTLILNDLAKDLHLDFFVLCSSTTSITTPFAESDYSAANAFLDVFAQYSNSVNKFYTLSINWPGWKEIGQLANLKMLKGTEEWKKSALDLAISPQEGLEAFKLALSSDLNQVIVSPESLENFSLKRTASFIPETTQLDDIKIDDEENEKTNVEENLALIWKDILGVMENGKDDNFFELGGHSLLAMQLISAIRKTFLVDLNLENILDEPTFSAICKKINELISLKKVMQ